LGKCNHYDICGRDALEGTGEDLCVLHSHNSDKDKTAFYEALTEHRKEKGDRFDHFVFPEYADFANIHFTGEASFYFAKFIGEAKFEDAKFMGNAYFWCAEFTEGANFQYAEFAEGANFRETLFNKGTDFEETVFIKKADFANASFHEESKFRNANFTGDADFENAYFFGDAYFWKVRFNRGVNFYDAHFSRKVGFNGASFSGRTLFDCSNGIGVSTQIFSGVEVDFRYVIIEPLDAITFRDVDLRECRLVGTDLRKAELVGVTWPKKGKRFRVYDEDAPLGAREPRAWHHIEQIYRQLKQNYEDRKDYERASDFHYGEKEMRRRNPETSRGLKFWLTLYWLMSGYGERWLRPLMWAAGLFLVSTLCYLHWDLLQPPKGTPLNSPHWWEICLYSLQVMTLLRPSYLEPVQFGGRVIYVLQSILGPILLGLFALALRQKLKR
jgi:uncharacterized protein YjbI with pentapeptide repeats